MVSSLKGLFITPAPQNIIEQRIGKKSVLSAKHVYTARVKKGPSKI